MSEEAPEKRPGAVRRLYNWVMGWADSPYGVAALFLIALVEASFFPIPPDVLLLALAMGAPRRSIYFALVCAAGSIVGAVFGYGIGWLFYDTIGQPIVEFYHATEKMDQVVEMFRGSAFFAIVVAGFTPIPFKVFTIAAGIAKIPLYTLLLASAISRTGRFLMVAGFIYFFGPKAKALIDKYFEVFTILFTILLVGGFFAIKYLH